ncbi:MAG: TonB-dependent receptor [Azospira oryzae]|nr:MAG: TonB-dependent receptor [Azospira oryzae]
MKLRYLVLVAALATLFSAHGQQTKTMSGNFSLASFDQLVNAIEQQTNYRLFYKPAWTDSVFVTLTVTNEKVSKVLDQALEGTDLHYSMVDNHIYIVKERQLLTDLPTDFFNEGNGTVRETVPFDFSDYERLEKLKKQAEERTYAIGAKTTNMQGTATLTGTVKDIKNGEAIIGAAVFIENPMIGVATDQFGHYSITLPRGRHLVKIKSVAMKTTQRQVILYNNGKLDIELEEEITPLKEVLVQSERDAKVTSMQMGAERLDIKTMKQMPLALGETDVMKVVLALPGVQSVGEGTVGLNVRGGATNQNLILFNNAVVYNPSHLFGFFSTFNPDVLKSVELYKSGITADYGGRLSSVLDVQSREGNLKKFSGSGGISPITGRFTLEGPIIKERTSFIIGVRSTYSDWILKRLDDPGLRNSNASFYDITANISHKFNTNNSLQLSGYISKDKFKLNSDTAYSYSDRNASLRWKSVFTKKLYGVFTGTFSQYSYSINTEINPVNAFQMDFSIKQFNGKADFTYFLTPRHTLTGGVSSTRYSLSPGAYNPSGSESLVVPDVLQHEQGLESAVYAGDDFEVSPKLSLYFGIRYSFYQYLGARDVYQYAAGAPRQENNIQDTLHYAAGKSIANYGGPEPRVSARYMLSDNSSIKFSYNKTRQYIQMLSNTTAITPTDIWKLSDTYIKPQSGDQVSIGYYKNLKGNTIETSVEAYYKTMHNTVDYKNGAVLLLNHHLETDVLNAQGKAYGIEFLLKKSSGKLNGWLSYTYSRSFLKTISAFSSETINRGEYYPSSYDKPHAMNFIGNYKVSRRFNFSLNLIYSTGRPITLPIAKYQLEGTTRVYYSDRNQYRIPDYFRTDVSINIEGNHKIKKLAHSSWTFAVYNLTGRRNAYSVFFVSQKGLINGYKLSVFGQPIPTITYNFKF